MIVYMLISYSSLPHYIPCACYLPTKHVTFIAALFLEMRDMLQTYLAQYKLETFKTNTAVIAGLEAGGKCNIQGEGPQGTQPQGERESVFKHHDSSGRLASRVCSPAALLQQLCVCVSERHAALPLPWV